MNKDMRTDDCNNLRKGIFWLVLGFTVGFTLFAIPDIAPYVINFFKH